MTTNGNDIRQFVGLLCREYGISYEDFFCDEEDQYDEKGNYIGTEYVYKEFCSENGELRMDLIEKAATVLGTDIESIINCDYDSVGRWHDKYPALNLRKRFEIAYEDTFYKNDENYFAYKLLSTFRDPSLPKLQMHWKFDDEDIKNRLFALLRRTDEIIPGTFHYGNEPDKIEISTCQLCHFEKFNILLKSYIEMIERASELFFKALDTELNDEEIEEYNIIVSGAGLMDTVVVSKYMHYDWVRACKDVIKKEGYTNFFAYVKVNTPQMLNPWRCAEFTDDKALVEKYVNMFPYAKNEMRHYAMDVLNFVCSFYWKDEEPVYNSDLLEVAWEENYEFEYEPDKMQRIYVRKTSEEMNGDEEYAEKLRQLSAPATKGGVAVVHRRERFIEPIVRLRERVLNLPSEVLHG